MPRAPAVLALSLLACSGAAATTDGGAPDGPAPPGSIDEALATEAFVWGYPLVVSVRTMQTLGALVGQNTLFNQAALSNASTRLVVSPNQDTLYSVAVVDVRGEPVVLSVPDLTDRYWTYQLVDAWTDSFRYLGTRATMGRGGRILIARKTWQGAEPDSAVRVDATTPQLLLLGRYLVKSPADVANVVALPRTLEPLSALSGGQPMPPPPLDGAPGKPQEVALDSGAFFDELGDALAINPPVLDADRDALARYAPLGIGPGLHPEAAAQAAGRLGTLAAYGTAAKSGLARIDAALAQTTSLVNGWTMRLDIGRASGDPLLRAAVARAYWGANVPEEAVYAVSSVDAAGAEYIGSARYRMHFDAAALPPADAKSGFWSLTLYGLDRFFVDNDLDRFAIGDRSPGLQYNPDGSLDLYIQSDAPAGHEANWLPAPASRPFHLMFRIYLPQRSVLDGKYALPGVTRM